QSRPPQRHSRPGRIDRAPVRQLSDARGARPAAQRPARAAALSRAVPATRRLARLSRRCGRCARSLDLPALARPRMNADHGRYQPLSYFQLMEVSLRELLVEKGILT